MNSDASAKGASRRAAAFVLAHWLATREFPAARLPDSPDRAFVQDLVYTAIRRLRPLRAVLGGFLRTWPKGELEALLYIGAAQILYMDDVPDFAAVSETVEAAKRSPRPAIARVVNGVLRSLLRARADIEARLAAAPAAERESFPSPLFARWERRFGAENAARLAAWHNKPAETTLAFAPDAQEPDADGTLRPCWRDTPPFVRLPRGRRVEAEPGFGEGRFIVQDPATAAAVELMDVRPGERVLDACAAPGGKTAQLVWRGARVIACEINPRRRKKLEETLGRLRLDATVVGELPAAGETFDKVLVDAPCSNTGVLRRRPDARWNWSQEKLDALVSLQAGILDACAARVRPGGTLVYSTCSSENEENGDQADAFLARHPDFRETARRESIPFETDHDGAFAVAFVRR